MSDMVRPSAKRAGMVVVVAELDVCGKAVLRVMRCLHSPCPTPTVNLNGDGSLGGNAEPFDESTSFFSKPSTHRV